MLIEVIVSAMLVGLIVVGTLTGFNAVVHTTADERLHNEAAVLAAQSQEQLRSDSATTLQALETAPHKFTRTVSNTTFTITQGASFLGPSEASTACSVAEGKRQSANAIRITSSVTWPQLGKTRSPVTESSIVTPPTGSALEIDVSNGAAKPTPISGVTAIVKYTPTGTGSISTVEGTTGASGCLLFGGIPATSATVEIPEKVGYVIASGALKWPTKEVTLAPNYTTHYTVKFAPGGAITAKFYYNGSPEYSHKNNAGTVTMPPEFIFSDTFVAFSGEMSVLPDFEVGSNKGNFLAGGVFEPLPGQYASEVTTPREPKYPQGNLFPFSEPWRVYGGDCTENDPHKVNGALEPETVSVKASEAVQIKVPLSHVALNLYKGKKKEVEALGAKAWENLETKTSYAATITNKKCAGVTPNNETEVKTRHEQSTTIGAEYGGHLARPFQPFGEYELCVYNGAGKTYTVTHTNSSVAGTAATIYLSQRSATERTEQRVREEGEEATAKKARETTERETKTKREEAELAARTKAEEAEATERAKWAKEKLPKKQKEEKEQAQTKAREAREATEATTRKSKETEEGNTRKTKEAEEKTRETNRKSKEAEETGEINAEVTVESGRISC